MQDRFKFRFWNKKDNQLQEWKGSHFWQALNNEDLIPMQCTGLKDNNGTLIYEGDIVKDDHEAKHQVVWCYNGYQLNPLFKNGYTIVIVVDEIEVIGNIYENKELLE